MTKSRDYTNNPVVSVSAILVRNAADRKNKGDLSAALGVANF
ncbi:MAG TPA: hypothetical protein VMO80_10185 [Terriglobales bacterium]|nr:hypothetical protein [Terriglobales bacterium]